MPGASGRARVRSACDRDHLGEWAGRPRRLAALSAPDGSGRHVGVRVSGLVRPHAPQWWPHIAAGAGGPSCSMDDYGCAARDPRARWCRGEHCYLTGALSLHFDAHPQRTACPDIRRRVEEAPGATACRPRACAGEKDAPGICDRPAYLCYLGATCLFAHGAWRTCIFIECHPHPPPMTGTQDHPLVSRAHAQTAGRMSHRMLTGSRVRRG